MAVAKIQPIELQIQQAVPIRSLSFLPVDGRPHPVSGSMVVSPRTEIDVSIVFFAKYCNRIHNRNIFISFFSNPSYPSYLIAQGNGELIIFCLESFSLQ